MTDTTAASSEFARARAQRIAAEQARQAAEEQVRAADKAQRRAKHEEAVETLDAALLTASTLGEQLASELIDKVESLKQILINGAGDVVRLGDRLNHAEAEVRATWRDACQAASEAELPKPPVPNRPGSRVHDRRDDVGRVAQAATLRRAGLSPGDYVLRALIESLIGGRDVGQAS